MSTLTRTARRALPVAALAACFLCHAAASPRTPATEAAARAAPVAVKNVTPGNGAQHVDVLAPVKITFNGALDPASISRAHVVLTAFGVPLGSSLSYDDAMHRITIKPIDTLGPLSHGTTYTLKIAGLLDSFGHAVTPFQSTFSTWLDPVRFDEAVYRGGEDGAISGRVKTSYDADGHRTRRVDYNSAGADGEWGTADDGILTWSSFDVRPDGLEGGQHDFSGAGPDGVWLTADDLGSSYSIYTYTPAGAPLEWAQHYDDAQLEACCAYSMVFSYDGNGVKTGATTFHAGADGILDTADDTVAWVETENYDALGRNTGYVISVHGVIASCGVRVWRGDSRLDYEAHYASAGPDRIPCTADDLLDAMFGYTYDKSGNLIRVTYSRDAGPDGVWRTADDVLERYTRFWVDDNDNTVKARVYLDPGPDRIWFTDDDVEFSHSKYDPTR